MRRLLEAFPAIDPQGREYEVSVYAEGRAVLEDIAEEF